MRLLTLTLAALVALTELSTACDSCYGPSDHVEMVRHVRRAQPESKGATTQPKGPLEWGQINFLHTTDTHGWLEGHLKEQNYGADWGDFVAFTAAMKAKAKKLGVDLLLVDTGDLHDGAGLSDNTSPNGNVSNAIFEKIPYDLLTIGNHELYLSDIAYETFTQFSRVYGEKYLTSNVQIANPATGEFEYIGQRYRYFTTEHGLRIMSFGVLFDFTGNSNASKVIPAKDLVQESWFKEQIARKDIDMFVLLGHNPVRTTVSSSTWGTIFSAIRKVTGETPITIFGGHTHIRDFVVLDDKTVGIESGRYCETLGWLSMNGLHAGNGTERPAHQPTPSRPAQATIISTSKASVATSTASASKTSSAVGSSTSASKNHYRYARRYLDWNRVTLEYHAGKTNATFNTTLGNTVTDTITSIRHTLNLTEFFGCAPQSYCMSCAPQTSNASIYPLLQTALAATVINETRKDIPRLIIINTGSIRFDLPKGPFTLDDTFIVSPFTDGFQFIPEVPYSKANQVLAALNAGPFQKKKKRSMSSSPSPPSPSYQSTFSNQIEECVNPTHFTKMSKRSETLTEGYTTTDDFGTDGDDTPHIKIPFFSVSNDLQANASFPTDGSLPDAVDLIFLDFIAEDVLEDLTTLGANYTEADVSYYMPQTFTTNSYLQEYVKMAWASNDTTCSSV